MTNARARAPAKRQKKNRQRSKRKSWWTRVAALFKKGCKNDKEMPLLTWVVAYFGYLIATIVISFIVARLSPNLVPTFPVSPMPILL